MAEHGVDIVEEIIRELRKKRDQLAALNTAFSGQLLVHVNPKAKETQQRIRLEINVKV